MIVFVTLDLGMAVPADAPVLPASRSMTPMPSQPEDPLRRTHDMLVLAWAECLANC